MLEAVGGAVRSLADGEAEDLYFTVAPPRLGSAADQARHVYRSVRDALAAASARIFAERIFAAQDAMDAVLAERRAALGTLDDGVRPTRVVVTPGATGRLAGVQIHAVAAPSRPRPISGDGAGLCGRELRVGERRWLTLSEISPGGDVSPREQAARMFQCTGQLLRQAGADMRSVARTWLWLKDICQWYGDFNAARTAFFKQEGLIRPDGARPRLPASTGIGLGVSGGAACALDLIALPGREEEIELLATGGDQNSAFAYGSAFSRAAVVPMPGGRTLLISGTAAIDAQGRTEHVGQIEAQIAATIRHVRALLERVGCRDEHVLSALVYCKTPAVEAAFRQEWSDLGWPAVSMVGDVCRDDLLFEIEAVAGPVPTAL